MESTGGWSEELAADLHEHGHVVSIVNPPAIKSFGQSELSRTKTDKADAALIARFCITMHPALWEPPSPLQQRLRRLGRRRVALDETRVQESNRLGAPGSSDVRPFPDDDLTLRGKLELLMWIPGIGERLAVTILGELPHISEFRSAKGTLALHGTVPARPIGEIGIGIVAVKDRQPSSSADAVHAGCRSNSLQPILKDLRNGCDHQASTANRSSPRSCAAFWFWLSASLSPSAPLTLKSGVGDVIDITPSRRRLALDV